MSDNDATVDEGTALQVVGLAPDQLVALPLADLRHARDSAVETETGLSYLRRLVQAPLDMVRGELERRAAGEPSDLATLVDDLPRILSEHSGSGGGRIPHTLQPTEIDPELAAELDTVTEGGMRIAMLPTASDDELVQMAGSLDSLERRVSRKRRLLHRTIDLLNAELARRYGSGELTPEGALADAGPDAGD
jgi:hypothetical protein